MTDLPMICQQVIAMNGAISPSNKQSVGIQQAINVLHQKLHGLGPQKCLTDLIHVHFHS